MTQESAAPPAVPGTVRLMTTVPLVMPADSARGEGGLRDLIEERPWVLTAVFAGLLAFFLLRRRRRD